MSSSNTVIEIIGLVAEVITIGFCASTTYRAFSLSKALPGHIYRARAEWIGSLSIILIGITAVGFASASGFFSSFVTNFLSGVFSYTTSFLIVFLFAWLSSTIGVASDLDFFHRTTLHWNTLKRFCWVLIALVAVGEILISITELNPCVSASCSPIVKLAPMAGGLLGVLLIILILYVSLVLYFNSRKISDKILKSHIRWIVLFTVTLVLAFFLAPDFPFSVIMAVATVFLFRASGFLTPAEKIESIATINEEPTRKKRYSTSSSLRYRIIALIMLAVSLFLAAIILNDDGLVKKLAPGNAEAFTSVTIIYGILFVLLATKVKIGFMLGLLSSTLWLFAQVANVLIPVNSFVTASNIALYFPRGFASYVLGLAPVHNPMLCPYTCPPFQFSALISLLVQVPLLVSCYLGLRTERKASLSKAVALLTRSSGA